MLTEPIVNDMPLLMEIRGKGIIRQRGNDCWDVQIYYPATKKVLRIGYDKRGNRIDSRAKALRVLMEVNTKIKEKVFDPAIYQKVSRLRFDTAITEWFEKHKHNYSPKSKKDYYNRINNLLIPQFQNDDVREIDSLQIDDFYHDLLTQGKSEKTISNILTILKAFYRDVKIYGIEPPVFPRVKESPEASRGWCDWDTFIGVVNEIPDQMDREFIITCRLEWLRPGECRALMWKDIDWGNDVLTIQKAFSLTELKSTKAGTVTYKHLHSIVKEYLLKRKGLPDAFIFTRKGKPYGESWIRKQWRMMQQRQKD